MRQSIVRLLSLAGFGRKISSSALKTFPPTLCEMLNFNIILHRQIRCTLHSLMNMPHDVQYKSYKSNKPATWRNTINAQHAHRPFLFSNHNARSAEQAAAFCRRIV